MASFNQLLQASYKSKDTEEWLDTHFTRPIGLVFALFWNKFGVHPNAITILSIFLGAAAGVMFYYTDLTHNIMGVLLLMLANFCDSTDGQMARLSGKKTLVGRVLDGASGDVWFLVIYFALVFRLWHQQIPGTDVEWGVGGFAMACIAGFLCHSPQSMMADYYRQIHLFFLKGKEGSELDSSERQMEVYESTPKSKWFARQFYKTYADYCRKQERRTPHFQRFLKAWNEAVERVGRERLEPVRQQLLDGSRPLMAYANILTFNTRAICLYATCLLGCPWVYLLFEIVVLNIIYVYMHHKHEALCKGLTEQLAQWGQQQGGSQEAI